MDSKSFIASKTVWGIILISVPQLLPLFGITFTADDTAMLGDTGDKVFQAVGALLALYGRFAAKTTLALK